MERIRLEDDRHTVSSMTATMHFFDIVRFAQRSKLAKKFTKEINEEEHSRQRNQNKSLS